MPSVVNKSERLISVEGHQLTPLVAMDLPDAVLKNDRVQELIKAGELEIATPNHKPKVEPKPIKSVAVAAKKPQAEDKPSQPEE